MILKRLGRSGGNQCESGHYCPQILEAEDHSLVVVGLNVRAAAIKAMPSGPGVGPKEGAVMVPRKVVLEAVIDLLRAA